MTRSLATSAPVLSQHLTGSLSWRGRWPIRIVRHWTLTWRSCGGRQPQASYLDAPLEQVLTQLRVVRDVAGRAAPTWWLSMFGNYPQAFEPQLVITFLHYYGVTEEEPTPRGVNDFWTIASSRGRFGDGRAGNQHRDGKHSQEQPH